MFDFLLQNDLLSAILAFGIVLIPSILVHELGHFIAGKSAGVTILEFGIGFPPRAAKLFTWRETEFTLNIIPLGGFVRPLGEDFVGPSTDEEKLEKDRAEAEARVQPAKREQSYYEADLQELRARGITEFTSVNDIAPLPRIWFLAAGAIANFVFAYFVFVLVGLSGVPEVVGARVGLLDVPETGVLAQAGLQPNDYVEQINGQFFESVDELNTILASAAGEDVTLRVRRFMDLESNDSEVLTITLPAWNANLLNSQMQNTFVLIGTVVLETPASDAGLQPGDIITTFNGEDLGQYAEAASRLQELTQEFAGTSVTLVILRDGEIIITEITPRENPPAGEGSMGIVIGDIDTFGAVDDGVVYSELPQRDLVGLPIGEAVSYGFTEMGSVFQTIAEFPVRLVQGSTEAEERRIVSVVGISQLGGAFLQDTVEEEQASTLLSFIALVSIALGFTNLLPIPALDGGRIVFVLIELVRGKPISPEKEGYVHMVGLIFLLSIGVFFIINDLANPLTDLVP